MGGREGTGQQRRQQSGQSYGNPVQLFPSCVTSGSGRTSLFSHQQRGLTAAPQAELGSSLTAASERQVC